MPGLIKLKKSRRGPRKYTIPDIQTIMNDTILILEAEVLRLKERVKLKPLSLDDHRTLAELSKNLLNISKEQRLMKKEESFDNMSDEKLEELAKHAAKHLKKKEKKEAREGKEELDDQEQPTDPSTNLPSE